MSDPLHDAVAHHRAGRLAEALALYRQVLAAQPDDPDALNLGGLAALHTGDASAALEMLSKAVAARPDFADAHTNLGLVLEASARHAEAVASYDRAIALDATQSGTHFNRGNALHSLERFADAAGAYRRALEIEPGHAEVHVNLGASLMAAGELVEAADALRTAIDLDPAIAEAHNNLGAVLNKLGDFEAAAEACRAALGLRPDYAEASNNLGNALVGSGDGSGASGAFRDALRSRPDFVEAHYSLAGVLHNQGKSEEAMDAYRRVLELDPDNATARHMLAALSAETTATAPRGYVVGLFDDFAPRFDGHMETVLAYRVPELMRRTAGRLYAGGDPGDAKPVRRALDLGCGTGLVGARFRDLVDELHGVDVSEGMTAEARNKDVYDALHIDDLVSHLDGTALAYDLVLAADVFIYVGDLAPVFAAIGRRLTPGGRFVFSVESLGDGDYALRPSGRYAQSPAYIRRLAAGHGFTVALDEAIVVRRERDRPIDGMIFWLENPSP